MSALASFVLVLAGASQATTGSVSGRLLSPEGAPVAGVRVALMNAASEQPAREAALISLAQSDKSGAYILENVPAGRYFILAGPINDPSYYPGAGSPSDAKAIDVVAGTRVSVGDFVWTRGGGVQSLRRTETPGRISGVVRDGTNNPLQNVTILVSSMKPDDYVLTSTDPKGMFELLDVPAGEYTLRALAPVNSGYGSQGYERVSHVVVVEENKGIELSVRMRMALASSLQQRRPDLYVPYVRSFDGAQISISANALQLESGELLLDPRTASSHSGEVDVEVVFSNSGSLLYARIVDPAASPDLARVAVEQVRGWKLAVVPTQNRPWTSLRAVVAIYPSSTR